MNIKKLMRQLPTGFAEDVASMDAQTMRAAIIQSNENIRRTARERESDEKLSGARELVKDLSQPYSAAISTQNAKIQYLLWQLEEKGELLEAVDDSES